MSLTSNPPPPERDLHVTAEPPPMAPTMESERGKWLALTAALLGWMFDGFEMGLFPVVARTALSDLINSTIVGLSKEQLEKQVGLYNSLTFTAFLVGAATGGVLFGWLGDRVGRVRAMTLSILTYALCSGLAGFAFAPWHMIPIRFVAALGMGGEWSLGVALVMEVWGGRSRALLAGVIGAAANAGYLLVGIISIGLGTMRHQFATMGLPDSWVQWRLLMLCGALPALLTFFIRMFVPESQKWEQEKARGTTSAWASRDLIAVLAGVGLCGVLMLVWIDIPQPDGREAVGLPLALRLAATAVLLIVAGDYYLSPMRSYLNRANEPPAVRRWILYRMLLAALISGVPLLATWGAVQWAPVWADQLSAAAIKEDSTITPLARYWKEYTQMAASLGAIIGCVIGAMVAGALGRRIAYVMLCVGSLGSVLLFYLGNGYWGGPIVPAGETGRHAGDTITITFLLSSFLMGAFSAAFYGWLPLYLPELFPTRVRATGQGFGFNFGRIIAAIGVLQVPVLMGKPPDYARACSSLAFIYLLGLVVIWLAPETRGKPLPE